MGFRRALDLRDLVQRLVGVAGLVVGRVDRLAVALHQVEHEAVARIGVVRDGEQRRALGALILHPLPQDFRIVGVQRRQDHVRQVLRVAEDDDAVQVALLRIRRPFEAGEGGERAGDVVRLRRLDDLGPDRPRQRRIAQLRVPLAVAHVAQDAGERLQPHVGVGRGHALGDLRLADRAVGVRHLVEDAHVLGMVGHHVEVQGDRDLHVRPAAAGDRPCPAPRRRRPSASSWSRSSARRTTSRCGRGRRRSRRCSRDSAAAERRPARTARAGAAVAAGGALLRASRQGQRKADEGERGSGSRRNDSHGAPLGPG